MMLNLFRRRPRLVSEIAAVRESVVAVLRVRRPSKPKPKKGGQQQAAFEVTFVGTAWCIVADRLLLTAHHVLNNGQPRNPADKFHVFTVPHNGPVAYHIPVNGFPLEDAAIDMAVLEISAPSPPTPRLPNVPITFRPQADGQSVLTYGFPAPVISAANIDANGNWLGGHVRLISHGNEGIVSSQFDEGGHLMYELNVGWHHGESGGPILRLKPLAAFAIMQRYRNIQTQHGVVAGPHQGWALSAIERTLREFGVTTV